MKLYEHLREITKRADKATPGPWGVVAWDESLDEVGHMLHGLQVQTVDERPDAVPEAVAVVHAGAVEPPAQARHDAEFIARTRTDVPRLVAYCEILARAVEAKTKFEDHYVSCRVCKHDWYCQEGNALYGASLDAYKTALRLLETGEAPQ